MGKEYSVFHKHVAERLIIKTGKRYEKITATTEGMIHHVKGCMVGFAPDIVLLHCGTNDLKKYLTPQKIAQNILKLAEEASDGG